MPDFIQKLKVGIFKNKYKKPTEEELEAIKALTPTKPLDPSYSSGGLNPTGRKPRNSF